MRDWKITGLIATIIIVLSIPAYLLKEKYTCKPPDTKPVSTFVGADKCRECHKYEYEKWQGSHHDKAMDVATEESVLGDFNNSVFEYFGIKSRFYRENGKFYVHTRGPKGEMSDFEITHTFGFYPLQQYLIPFPGGRLQCLPIAWNVKEKKWYHLYPDEPLDPADWLYWTNSGLNWNGMCAECHSTNLKKNYDPNSNTYKTTWSEIDISCEACHGPGSLHVKWAEAPEMARTATDNYGLVVKTSGMTSQQQVELCAPCHSRRMSLGDNTHDQNSFLDYSVPQLLSPGMYFADGQIIEEVYVYGSFVQSKMYDRDVRCSDCHDVHSIKRIKQGNQLCLQCHRTDIYDTKTHHFHKKEGEKGKPIISRDGKILFDVGTGAQCEQCHIPGRNYMGIDYRPDHSFRVPRPDLSETLKVPNACNRCHIDQSTKWATEYITKWYGSKYKPHYGTVIDAGRKALPEAQKELIRLVNDRLFPPIVRETALSLLASYPGEEMELAYERALSDEEPLMRQTAINRLDALPLEKRIKLMVPLLYDPVKAVRIEAAQNLAGLPPDRLNAEQKKKFQAVLDEYRQAMEYTADFAPSRHNLGNMYASLGQMHKAEENYQAAIRIDNQFYPAKVNLAMLYNQLGKNNEAERLLREVVQTHPQMSEVTYFLGLLLAERKKYEEATFYLSFAARGLPKRSRVHYNLGLLLDYLKKDLEAEAALTRALKLEPENIDYLKALAEYYLKRKRHEDARRIVEQMIAKYPSKETGLQMLDFIKEMQRQND